MFFEVVGTVAFFLLTVPFIARSASKEECVLKPGETNLCIVFYPVQNFHFLTSSETP